MKLLIVEDDELHCTFIRNTIGLALPECTGIEIAEDSAVALSKALESDIDSIIMDIQLPSLNGVEIARRIWRSKPSVRILFWSNFSDEAYVRGISKIVPQEAIYGYVLKSSSEEHVNLAIRSVFVEDQCVIDKEIRGVQHRSSNRDEGLTELEFEVLLDIAIGLTDRSIAARRKISLRSVQNRLHLLYIKLGMESELNPERNWGKIYNARVKVIHIALLRGLINPIELKRHDKETTDWIDEN